MRWLTGNLKDIVAITLTLVGVIFTIGAAWTSVNTRVDITAEQVESLETNTTKWLRDFEQQIKSEQRSVTAQLKELDQGWHEAELERNTLKSDLKYIKEALDRAIKLLENQ